MIKIQTVNLSVGLLHSICRRDRRTPFVDKIEGHDFWTRFHTRLMDGILGQGSHTTFANMIWVHDSWTPFVDGFHNQDLWTHNITYGRHLWERSVQMVFADKICGQNLRTRFGDRRPGYELRMEFADMIWGQISWTEFVGEIHSGDAWMRFADRSPTQDLLGGYVATIHGEDWWS